MAVVYSVDYAHQKKVVFMTVGLLYAIHVTAHVSFAVVQQLISMGTRDCNVLPHQTTPLPLSPYLYLIRLSSVLQ